MDDGRPINNERLEFLGDAVIEAATSDYVFIEFPDKDEGFMTQLRSRIVSRQSLNALAIQLGLDKQVIANAGAGLVQKHIFGDAFEAMMGAIYLDQGYEFVNRLLINRLYYRYLNIDDLTRSDPDYKSRLIEWCQKGRHRIVFGRTGTKVVRFRIRISAPRSKSTAWRSDSEPANRKRRRNNKPPIRSPMP